MEGNIFFFDSVFGALDAFEAFMGIDVQIEGDVGFEVIGRKMAELTDPIEIKASCAALISHCRIVKPVAEDNFVFLEGRHDHLLDMLGSIGKK